MKNIKKKAGGLIPVQIEVEGKEFYENTEQRETLCTLHLKKGNELRIYDEQALLLILKELL